MRQGSNRESDSGSNGRFTECQRGVAYVVTHNAGARILDLMYMHGGGSLLQETRISTHSSIEKLETFHHITALEIHKLTHCVYSLRLRREGNGLGGPSRQLCEYLMLLEGIRPSM
jgi:hypothetical protein